MYSTADDDAAAANAQSEALSTGVIKAGPEPYYWVLKLCKDLEGVGEWQGTVLCALTQVSPEPCLGISCSPLLRSKSWP